MNKVCIIGNLTKDPELRSTQAGIQVCSFTVAVNRRRAAEGQPDVDYFRVSAWRQLAENCAKYLAKGRKVCVIGGVSVSTYADRDGKTRASLEVNADEVEFLSPRDENRENDAYYAKQSAQQKTDKQTGYVEVDDEDLPF